MKSSLALVAEPVLAIARRLFWLSLWFLWVPMGLYIAWLKQGQTLILLQLALLGVAVIGLSVINAETAAVFLRHWQGRPSRDRGILQRWFMPWKDQPRLSSTRPVKALPISATPIPFVSVVVVAYLPNEQDIIEETLRHWLTQVEVPTAGWEVILAYNTPTQLPVEARLYRLARQNPALVLLPVSQSRSKAENLNAALRHVRGEMTCIFDADHHPAPDCLRLAWEWLSQEQYDGVQGRNIIRNADDNWMTQLIAVEFECIYGISHYGRSLLADTALFGGSNGYWRTEAIRSLGFYPNRLTEDIDATVRGLLSGYRLVHDPAIVTTELAPTSLRGLWLQRQRWSQGWLEVAGIYIERVRRCPYLDPVQKTYWLLMLLFSQCFYPLVWQVVPMMLSTHISLFYRDLKFENLNLLMMGLLTVSTVLQVSLAMRLRPAYSNYSRRHGGLYCLLSPVYFWLKVLIGMAALYNYLRGSRVWHVTARTRRSVQPLALGLEEGQEPYPVKSR
jgi:cellulose synthase/poly-beta-1,6-N-acetylglucosamine synthase-like glycosyltransferase